MIDKADTAFVLICAAMVLFMTPALGVLYSGLGRKKSSEDIMAQSWISIGVVTVIWFICGYSLAYGADHIGVFGGLEHLFLKDVSFAPDPYLGAAIPPLAFFILQVVFAIITPALVSGAVVERLTMKAYILFLIFWSILVYIPLAHMVWGGGLLSQIGLLDYAGGTVVHISAGFSSLAAAYVVGRRKNIDNEPHELGYASIGCGIILFGWLAFNGSGGLGINEASVYAFTNSLIGSAAGMVVWCALAVFKEKKADLVAIMMGCLAGLVGITPGAAYVTPQSAVFIGGIVAVVCYFCMQMKANFPVDDTLDVWALHGVGGLAGTILVGIFADSALCTIPHAMDRQLMVQMGSVYAVAVGSFMMTWLIFIIIEKFVPLRMPEEAEEEIEAKIFKARKEAFGKAE